MFHVAVSSRGYFYALSQVGVWVGVKFLKSNASDSTLMPPTIAPKAHLHLNSRFGIALGSNCVESNRTRVTLRKIAAQSHVHKLGQSSQKVMHSRTRLLLCPQLRRRRNHTGDLYSRLWSG